MAWFSVGLVSEYQGVYTWTRTNGDPHSGSLTLDQFDTCYHGFVVSYPGGGTTLPEVNVTSTSDGGSITAPEIPGYDFNGWFSWSGARSWTSGSVHLYDATVRVSFDRQIGYPTIFGSAGTMTIGSGSVYYMIYAKYSAKRLVVTFDTNGGVMPSGTSYFGRYTYSYAYDSLPTPTRTGYTFAGWFTAATGGTLVTAQTIVTNPSDHTLYAHWTSVSVQHTLYFNANGGEVSEASRLVYSGTAYGTLPTPTWAYHTFAGWFTEPYSGTQVSAATTMGDDDATVYAHWTDDTTTVTFNGNGGEPSTQTITYPSGSKYGSLPSATRSGFILAGWFTAATGGTRVEPSDVVSAQPLYAQWLTSGGTAEGVIWNKDTDFVIEMPAQ